MKLVTLFIGYKLCFVLVLFCYIETYRGEGRPLAVGDSVMVMISSDLALVRTHTKSHVRKRLHICYRNCNRGRTALVLTKTVNLSKTSRKDMRHGLKHHQLMWHAGVIDHVTGLTVVVQDKLESHTYTRNILNFSPTF